jgi:hypothetical protein
VLVGLWLRRPVRLFGQALALLATLALLVGAWLLAFS